MPWLKPPPRYVNQIKIWKIFLRKCYDFKRNYWGDTYFKWRWEWNRCSLVRSVCCLIRRDATVKTSASICQPISKNMENISSVIENCREYFFQAFVVRYRVFKTGDCLTHSQNWHVQQKKRLAVVLIKDSKDKLI